MLAREGVGCSSTPLWIFKSEFVEVHGRRDQGVAEKEVVSGTGGRVGLQGFNSSYLLVFKRVALHHK